MKCYKQINHRNDKKKLKKKKTLSKVPSAYRFSCSASKIFSAAPPSGLSIPFIGVSSLVSSSMSCSAPILVYNSSITSCRADPAGAESAYITKEEKEEKKGGKEEEEEEEEEEEKEMGLVI